jgi:hypothetical protein
MYSVHITDDTLFFPAKQDAKPCSSSKPEKMMLTREPFAKVERNG